MTDFEQIYSMYFADVERYLLAITKNADLAEELTAQTFFLALKSLSKFQGQCDIRTWLCAIARNCYFSHLRKLRPTVSVDELIIPDIGPSIEEQLFDKESAMHICRYLHKLPEPYKEVFYLRVFGQMTFSDIGNIFGKTQNWACVTFHRARQKIFDALEESR